MSTPWSKDRAETPSIDPVFPDCTEPMTRPENVARVGFQGRARRRAQTGELLRVAPPPTLLRPNIRRRVVVDTFDRTPASTHFLLVAFRIEEPALQGFQT